MRVKLGIPLDSEPEIIIPYLDVTIEDAVYFTDNTALSDSWVAVDSQTNQISIPDSFSGFWSNCLARFSVKAIEEEQQITFNYLLGYGNYDSSMSKGTIYFGNLDTPLSYGTDDGEKYPGEAYDYLYRVPTINNGITSSYTDSYDAVVYTIPYDGQNHTIDVLFLAEGPHTGAFETDEDTYVIARVGYSYTENENEEPLSQYVELYESTNYEGFDRSALSELFANYYNSDTEITGVQGLSYLSNALVNKTTTAIDGIALANLLAVVDGDVSTATDLESIKAFFSGITGDNLSFGAHTSNAYEVCRAYIEWIDGGEIGEAPTRPNTVLTEDGALYSNKANIAGSLTVTGSFSVALTKVEDVISENGYINGGACSHISVGVGDDFILADGTPIGCVVKVYFEYIATRVSAGIMTIRGGVLDMTTSELHEGIMNIGCTIGSAGYVELLRVDEADYYWAITNKTSFVYVET